MIAAAMLVKTFLATAVLGFLGASTALADNGHNGRGRGNAYGHYRQRPAVVSARVVDVEPLVRYVTVNRPREECWDEVVREPVRPLRCGWPDGCRQHRRRRDRPAVRQRQRPRRADGARCRGGRCRRASTRGPQRCGRDARRRRAALRGRQRPRDGADRRRLSRDVSARRPQLHDADGSASRRLGAARGDRGRLRYRVRY